MAEQEIYDHVPTMTAGEVDYTTAHLAVTPTTVVREPGGKNQKMYRADSGRRVVVTISSQSDMEILLQFDKRTKSDAGIVFDFYHNTAKGNGMARTFLFDHPDGHVYVVRFGNPELIRDWPAETPGRQTIVQVKLIVEGKIIDA